MEAIERSWNKGGKITDVTAADPEQLDGRNIGDNIYDELDDTVIKLNDIVGSRLESTYKKLAEYYNEGFKIFTTLISEWLELQRHLVNLLKIFRAKDIYETLAEEFKMLQEVKKMNSSVMNKLVTVDNGNPIKFIKGAQAEKW